MNEAVSFQFLQPAWLLTLPPLWGLVWLFVKRDLQLSMWRRLCDPRLLERMQQGKSKVMGGNRLAWMLTCLLTLAALSAAGPSWRKQAQPLFESSSARVIALDLSREMLVRDVKPDRFGQALAAVREIVDSKFDGETGLVVFAGAAFVVSPLSRDSATLDAFVDSLKPGLMPLEGLRIDLAIERARELLAASVTGNGRIIVVTSGSEETGRALEAASRARADDIQVSIMAIGTSAGGPRIEVDGGLARDSHGGYLLAKTNFADLRRIAAAGGGAMISLTHASPGDELLGSRIKAGILATAEPDTGEGDAVAVDDGYWLVWLMLPFALLLFRRNLIWMLLVAILLPGVDSVRAAEPDSLWQNREAAAFQAFRQGDFERAGELSKDPSLRGAAYYRRGKYEQALESYSLGDSASAFYNRGNTLVQLNRLEDAVSAYTRALELDPALAAARYNRQLVQLFLETEEKSPQQESDDSADDSGTFEPIQQSGSESLSGIPGQQSTNPGNEQQLGPGLGASRQSGMIDPFEEYTDGEQRPADPALLEYLNQPQAQRKVESWISELPVSSSDLFKRKFMRDYQRQLRQTR
ncbi:MAG: VWA domain-containing protein [Gammaproteobacteria bacterium]|jgi:Ca-activated chloride channel family protein